MNARSEDIAEIKCCRQNADNRAQISVQVNGVAYDRGIGIETALP